MSMKRNESKRKDIKANTKKTKEMNGNDMKGKGNIHARK